MIHEEASIGFGAFEGQETFVDFVTGFLEQFIEAWESEQSPPNLREYLPTRMSGDGFDAAQELLLVELIKADLEYRWQRFNHPKRLSEYMDEFPELAHERFPADLIYEEFHARKSSGFAVEPEEYYAQFPHQEAELRRLLELDKPYESTAVVRWGDRKAIDRIEIGETLGDFQLVLELGVGAFARVFLARQQSMQRLVALKVSTNKGTEHQTLAQFDHPYIVRVFDQRLDTERGLRLLYMEYIPGGSLSDVIKRVAKVTPSARNGQVVQDVVRNALFKRGEVRPTESTIAREMQAYSWPEVVCWMGTRLASALDYAHQQGVLHRDLKPANVLLTAEGAPKLVDFNVSYCASLEGVSPAAFFGGTLGYMSPEQLEAYHPFLDREPDTLTPEADIYSLGVILWELLTGERPFHDQGLDNNWDKSLKRMIEERNAGLPAESYERLPPNTPRGLINALEKCLSPEPEQRWNSGKDLSAQLRLAGDEGLQRILNPPKPSWVYGVRPYSFLILLLCVLIPNVAAGVFNFVYNHNQIVANLTESQHAAFMQIQLVINAIAYPAGIGIASFLIVSTIRTARQLEQGVAVDRSRLKRMRHRALMLGRHSVVIGLLAWVIAGVAYPISIAAVAGVVPASVYAHFFASLLLCGLIASSYPFFGLTYFSLRLVYPRLLHELVALPSDRETLAGMERRCGKYFATAILVPLFSVLLVEATEQSSKLALVVLSGGGMVGSFLLYQAFRALQDDFHVLLSACEKS